MNVNRFMPWGGAHRVLAGLLFLGPLNAFAAKAPPKGPSRQGVISRTTAPLPDWSKVGPVQSWARLIYAVEPEDDWKIDPSGDLSLMTFIRQNTAIVIPSYWFSADAEKMTELASFPFIFMHGQRPPRLTPAARNNLREYLLRGGFLFAEDCVHPGATGPAFFDTMRDELRRIVPEATFTVLPKDHPVFHSVFDMPNGLPELQAKKAELWALQLNGRVLALLSATDLHCAWTYGDAFGGTGTQKLALQMGTNIYVFAMTQGMGR